MLKFIISDDKQWLVLTQFPNDVEKKQIEISLTKKIHNFYFHPLVKKNQRSFYPTSSSSSLSFLRENLNP